MKKSLILLFILLVSMSEFGCKKYDKGPLISLRSKKNRVGHKIGKKWKSDKYLLQFGQEGYALSIPGTPGFFDIGDWEFNGNKEKLVFDSNDYDNYEMTIHQLKHKKLKLEGVFPFDEEIQVHEFTLQSTVDKL